jgi:hypothetical protein
MNVSKCHERASQPGLGYSPFPLLVVMSKMHTSRTVRDAITDCPRLNSNGKNTKSTTVGGARWVGQTAARTPQTVRLGPADCPQACRDRPPGPPELHTVLSSFEVNNGLSAIDPRIVRPKAIFLEKHCQKPYRLNKSQRPADRPPQGPGLSAPQQKTDFSQDFQRNLFNKRCHPSSKCNAC